MMREMAWALRLTGISPQCKLVAIYIGDLASPDRPSAIQISRLCEFACVDEGAVRASIEELAIATGMSWEEVEPGRFEFHLPLPKEKEAEPRLPDASPLAMYVMSCGDRTKIGVAKNVASRRLSIQPYSATPVVVEWSIVGPAHLVRRAERAAHQSLGDKRIHGEWYTIGVPAAIDVAKQYLREAGVAAP